MNTLDIQFQDGIFHLSNSKVSYIVSPITKEISNSDSYSNILQRSKQQNATVFAGI